MKDINEKALALGMGEATKLLNGQLEKGRIDGIKMGQVLSAITPTLSYDNVKHVDVVVEAVVENPKVKAAVLGEVEGIIGEDAVLASNTSTIPISAGQGSEAPAELLRHALLQPGAPHATGGDHPRRADLR